MDIGNYCLGEVTFDCETISEQPRLSSVDLYSNEKKKFVKRLNRRQPRLVITGNTVLHVGGDGRKSIENWTLNEEGSFDIAETDFATNVWLGYAETFVLE